MSALLIYLVLTPIYVYKERKRKILFVFILFVLTYFYLGYEDIEPVEYTLHLIPVSLTLAIWFEGSIPSIFTWIAFNFGSSVVLHNEPLPVFVGSTFMLVAGLLFKHRVISASLRRKLLYSIGLLTGYTAFYLGAQPVLLKGNLNYACLTIALSYLSTSFVTFLFYHVKKQEIHKEKLLRLEKDRMVGQLAASVSHEIRNPLTATRGFLQMMEQKEYSVEERKRYLSLAISGIDQANDIITEYLHYAKPNNDQQAQLDVKEELASILRFISPSAFAGGVAIDISHSSENPMYIWGESKKFRQCLMNLIKNAIESMPGGGTLTIHTHQSDKHIQVWITDTGVGMSKAQINSLGVPFFTTKKEGTGLGLVVVMSIIKSMNGKITYSSNVNKGTVCLIQFQTE
ncbi:ATP-binding protein [Paenibacillus hexagrammi]|uniref:histidine kinase n=1 Tax=Paenibacillus hexagrammi TaxID=2908839 RepID=A0ABY3SNZ1_9BACL|nr:ATP-binding protein [Paenibacillus sp. YPD9-1]UJF35419.1 ATP-binding protein [Paenibacillus sp. YPD9-1]